MLMALSIALSWLTLMGLPESGVLPEGFRAAVSAWGRASVISSLALSLMEKLGNLPLPLPATNLSRWVGGYASAVVLRSSKAVNKGAPPMPSSGLLRSAPDPRFRSLVKLLGPNP